MKNALLGIGVLGLAGFGIYMYMKNKPATTTSTPPTKATGDDSKPKDTTGSVTDKPKGNGDLKPTDPITPSSTNVSSETSNTSTSGSTSTSVATESGSSSPSSNTSSTGSSSKKDERKQSRLDKKVYKSICGRRPILKKKRASWQACVDAEKAAMYSSANGLDDIFENFDASQLDLY